MGPSRRGWRKFAENLHSTSVGKIAPDMTPIDFNVSFSKTAPKLLNPTTHHSNHVECQDNHTVGQRLEERAATDRNT